MSVAVVLLVIGMVSMSVARAGVLSVPEGYTPEKKWPVVVCTQNSPSAEVMAKTPYFLVHAGGMGVKVSEGIRDSLKQVAGQYNIDPLRIYATSFSRGGQEIMLQASQYPDRFAAIAPVAHDLRPIGDFGRRMIERVSDLRMPVLGLYGTGDNYREEGMTTFATMKAAGVPVIVETYPGGHDPKPVWDTERNKVWLEFFARHRLDPYPREITHWVDHKRYSRAFWVDATLVRDMSDAGGKFTVRVRDGNRIEIAANDRIAGLDLFLNDRLVDANRPVTVVQGTEVLYQGPVLERVALVLREGEKYDPSRVKPLWEELEAIRRDSRWMAELRAAGKDGESPAGTGNR